MIQHLGHAIALVFGTVLLHATCTLWVLHSLRFPAIRQRAVRSPFSGAVTLALLVFLMSLAAVLESGLWAVAYRWVGALPTLQEALYFSLVTFTTLGYGDVTLNEPWRLLGAFQAANGIILFGWTTALIVSVAQRMFAPREDA
jgi:hypothetical protein